MYSRSKDRDVQWSVELWRRILQGKSSLAVTHCIMKSTPNMGNRVNACQGSNYPAMLLHIASRVIVNGIAGKPITLKRGVRQGDPLSPYIFIMAFDFLSKWISRLVSEGLFKVPKLGVFPSLLYADDTIFFFKPTHSQAVLLNLVLTIFGFISGLKLNAAKSDLITMNTDSDLTTRIATALGCNTAQFPLTYLGLPLTYKRLTKNNFDGLLQRFQKKLMGWRANFFSVAGRLVLLNSCLSSLPVYYMSVFKFPISVIHKIDRLRRDFLWHGNHLGQRKLSIVPWDMVIKPKQCGGLGVIDLKAFNSTLLSKWLWKWLTPAQSLWKLQLSALYQHQPAVYPKHSVIQASLIQASFLFQCAFSFSVGNGDSALFWHHNWGLGLLKFGFQELYSFALEDCITLSTFTNCISNPLPLFSHLLPHNSTALSQLRSVITLINTLKASDRNFLTTTSDIPFWKLQGASGIFTTSSAYNFIKSSPTHSSYLPRIWPLRIPPRFKIFIWRLLQNKLATLDNLQRRGWCLPNRCVLCCSDSESVLHLFSQCALFSTLRSLVQNDPLLSQFTAGTLFPQNPFLLVQSTETSKETIEIWAVAFFILWRERCARMFSDKSKQTTALLQEILSECTYLRFLTGTATVTEHTHSGPLPF
ncbi:hypothetical protein LUZ61_015530 [Rhynchospora tenuis]|uniref:Reverse transcriptase domain-containing protein n=1 Tax=Rhynchospora tenuis TaxID=198213 RepID=A0AAD5Z3U1_9POAL|nr:hypothetical protein LUZ61_015530 [Rhynchospora tenuis]